MGQGESKDAEYVTSASLFSSKEKEHIKQLFNRIVQGNNPSFNERNFNVFLKPYFSELFVGRLFHAILTISGDTKLAKKDECTHHCFTVAMAHLTRGTLTQKAEAVNHMASDNPAVTPQDILQWTQDMLKAYVHVTSETPSYSCWKFEKGSENGLRTVALAITRDLFYEAKDKTRHCNDLPDNKNFDPGMLENWMSRSAIVLHVFDVVFNAVFPVCSLDEAAATAHFATPLIPSCSGTDWSKTQSLLSQYDVLMLNFHLPIELNKEWRLAFHTATHGESFATFYKNICNKGPSLIIIKDKDGHVFGGFASQSWGPNANFVGSSRCFLFSVLPHAEVYLASGLNENYMYLNSMQETLPNGLGMGGQFDYHGLYIDDEFGKGHSCAEPHCTTYSSPQLSGKRNFEIDTLEVWALGPEPKMDEDEENEKKSVLDKDPEAKAMLQIINKGPLSEGLREGDPMAEQPEERSYQPS